MGSAARIRAITYHLPAGELTNADLAEMFPEWTVDKISAKTGIYSRRVAGADEYVSHLATAAAERLFEESGIERSDIDYLILCTQTPDYLLPSTACIVQDNLGLPTSVGATDITLGCSGYIYGLGLAKGLIESGQARSVLVLTGDTYTKLLNPADRSVRTIFGDGASATLVTGDGSPTSIAAITYGTDGSGAGHLVVPHGGMRDGGEISPRSDVGTRSLEATNYDLFMDGPEIFNFTIRVVPDAVAKVLEKASLAQDDIDLFVFHQANRFMLDHLRSRLKIPEEKFFTFLEGVGNTVSSTIPIALVEAQRTGALRPGMRVMLLGFGVGLSWGGLVLDWE